MAKVFEKKLPMPEPTALPGPACVVPMPRSKSPSLDSKLSAAKTNCRETGISATATLMNFLRGMIGPGCLSLPLAFKQAGLWTAFSMVFIFGFLNNFCMLRLVHCSQFLSKIKGDTNLDYGGVAYEAFANSFPCLRPHKKKARTFINAIIVLQQMGICSVFYVFIAVHFKEIIETAHPEFIMSTSIYMLLMFIPVVLINFVRGLNIIAAFSLFANVLVLTSLVIIFQALIRAKHVTEQLPAITTFDGIATGAGSILYSFEGQAIVLPMENGLKHPQDMIGFNGVLSTGMALVTIVYATSGFYGYITYGEQVAGSITLNLPENVMYTIVKGVYVLVIYVGFVIQQYVIVSMLWPMIKKRLEARRLSNVMLDVADLLFRTLLVAIAMVIALAVPRLERIIPLVGVVSGMLLAFVIPSILDTVTFLPAMLSTNAPKWKIYAKVTQNSLLIILGLFGLVAGLKPNIVAIMEDE